MLTVDDYELIRRKFFLDGVSQRAIAAELGHSRKTVAKAIAQPVPPGYRQTQPRARPAIEPYRAIIDAWREEDQSQPRHSVGFRGCTSSQSSLGIRGRSCLGWPGWPPRRFFGSRFLG
jgi:DNA-binding transcriptional MocR family regulator